MKNMKVLVALVLAMALTMTLVGSALAASTPSITINTTSTNAADGQGAIADTTAYHWYRLFKAEIDTDPTNSGATQSGGVVAYYVDNAD